MTKPPPARPSTAPTVAPPGDLPQAGMTWKGARCTSHVLRFSWTKEHPGRVACAPTWPGDSVKIAVQRGGEGE